jgi:hypothetical protein
VTRQAGEWAERHRSQQQYKLREPPPGAQLPGLAVRHPRTSLGAAGHWIHLLAVAAPLVIGEVIKDSEKRWRALRLASVGAAIASEAVWTYRLTQERKKDEAAHEALANCAERCP